MPFYGHSLVDGLASDFGTVTGRADKLFYFIEKSCFREADYPVMVRMASLRKKMARDPCLTRLR
ncbi:MAG: hypothetical protein ACFFD8_02435, partial [Candidatus Thorarchaeota archaeon]